MHRLRCQLAGSDNDPGEELGDDRSTDARDRHHGSAGRGRHGDTERDDAASDNGCWWDASLHTRIARTCAPLGRALRRCPAGDSDTVDYSATAHRAAGHGATHDGTTDDDQPGRRRRWHRVLGAGAGHRRR